MKHILFIFCFVFIIVGQVVAQCYCCPCLRDRYHAYRDGIGVENSFYYGYVDNINYTYATYAFPVNRYFNYCPPCQRNEADYRYMLNCIRYNNANGNGRDSVLYSSPSPYYRRDQ